MESLQNKCVEKLFVKNEFDPFTIMVLERMVNFHYLTDEILISIYYKFKDSNKNILNKIPRRIKQIIDQCEHYERWSDSSFYSDYAEDEREYERNNMLEEESIEYLYDSEYNIDAVTFSFDI